MTKNLTGILAAAGAIAAYLSLTGFATYQNMPQADARQYKTHAVEMALICGTNNLHNDCYGQNMAKWLKTHGYKNRSAAITAEIKIQRARLY